MSAGGERPGERREAAPAADPADAARLETELRGVMCGRIHPGEPLARHTTMRIGGPALLLAVPDSEADVAQALRWATMRGLSWRVIGLGSNLLCPDEGFPGLAIDLQTACGTTRFSGTSVEVGAGVHLSPLIQAAAARGLAGLEGVAGVPGTVGGALAMNAGTAAGDMGAVVRRVRALTPDGHLVEITGAEMRFGYRTSRLQDDGLVALGAVLALRSTDAAVVRAELRARALRRRQTQPLELPNAGSIWRNPPGDYAGRLIEAAGCRGWRCGDAQVSPKHGNFIVNLGQARAAEVIGLMALVRAQVQACFGVRLEPELCWLWGREALLALLDGKVD
jgi:UDP-N-acetylmuramate dehydrogenase